MSYTAIGIINDNGEWLLNCRVNYDGKEREIDFMLDTGTEPIILSPKAAFSLGIEYNSLPKRDQITISGAGRGFARPIRNLKLIFTVLINGVSKRVIEQ
jgi:predicted aspartyl protease